MISMTRVDENTGRLNEAFLQLSQYLELDRDTRARVKATLRYPTFVLIAISLAVAVVNVRVIPAFAGVFAGMSSELPWQTKVLLNVSTFTKSWWHVLLAGGVGVGIAVGCYVNTPSGRFKWERLKLRLPIVGSIIHRATLSRCARASA